MVLSHSRLTLAWIPGWYACDQPLMGGLWAYYSLQATGPSRLKSAMEESAFHGRFSSGESSLDATFEVAGRIDRITHAKLGDLRGFTWGHGMFLVTRLDGTQLILDDEDGAGFCNIEGIGPQDWNLRVEMTVDADYLRKLHDARAKSRKA